VHAQSRLPPWNSVFSELQKGGVLLLIRNLSQNYGALPAIWDHIVLAVTQHSWTRPALTPSDRPVLDLPTTKRWKAELTLVLVIPKWFTCPQTVTHSSSNHLILSRPEIEPTTSQSKVRHSTVTQPSHIQTYAYAIIRMRLFCVGRMF